MDSLPVAHILIVASILGAGAAAIGALWLRRHLARVRQAAQLIDPLTRLATRQSFLERARTSLALRATDTHPPTLLMFDLDGFKQVNTRFGYSAGDRALTHFANLLREATGSNDLIGRYCGEEFCVLLSRDDPTHALKLAESVCEHLRGAPLTLGDHQISLTVTAGVAHFSAGQSIDALMTRAERLVYMAKSRGGNQALDQETRQRSRAWTGAPQLTRIAG
jgi:diguanylate cyclase (GGDEF)-like protein